MKRLLALAIVAAALAMVARLAADTNPNTLTVAVFGDSPYYDPAFDPHPPWTTVPPRLPGAEFNRTPAFVDTINADPSVQEVIHVGDIHSGSEACTTPFDQAIFNFWTAFMRPLIYTPGDNEWSDCSKAKELIGLDVFGKPVLYFNGDSHIYRSDNPLLPNSTCYAEDDSCRIDAWSQHPYYSVPNFHRIVVHGSTFPLEWLKLSIDTRAAWENASTPTSWGPFSWERKTQAQLTP